MDERGRRCNWQWKIVSIPFSAAMEFPHGGHKKPGKGGVYWSVLCEAIASRTLLAPHFAVAAQFLAAVRFRRHPNGVGECLACDLTGTLC